MSTFSSQPEKAVGVFLSFRCVLLTIAAVMAMQCPQASAADRSVVASVREGLRKFFAGDYEEAEKEFAAAELADPANLVVTYDRACALVASGDSDQAKELFLKSAMARDLKIATRSHYNLGCLVAEQGRAALGTNPVEATKDQREQGLSLLLAAVGHYRDCLKLDPAHKDSRHNLELIRMFIKHIQSQWDERDRQQQREGKDLLQLLRMIEDRQTRIRTQTRNLDQQAESSGRHSLAKKASDDQTTLQEEMEPLREKIDEEFASVIQQTQPSPPRSGTAATGTPPATGAMDEQQLQQMQAARQLLIQLADEAGQQMAMAADELETCSFSSASDQQLEVLDRLNQIYMVVAPFTDILQRAIQLQQQLTDESESITERRTSSADQVTDQASVDHTISDQETPEQKAAMPQRIAAASGEPRTDDMTDEEVTVTNGEIEFDPGESAWQQTRVTDWSRMLSLKAEAELPQVEAQVASLPAQADAASPDEGTKDNNGNEPDSAVEPAAQLQGLLEALKKAIELGPQVVEHSAAAKEHLRQPDVVAALPEQEQALELLKQIAESLPKQDQNEDQQSGQDQQQGEKQSEQNEQQNQEQNGQQDQKNKSEDQQDGNQQQDQSENQPSEQKQSQSDEQQQTDEQSPEARAMSILRRAREREQQHRDLQKQIQRIIGGRAPVEKDW